MKKHLLFFLFIFFATISFSQNQYVWLQKPSIPAVGRHGSLGISIGNRGYMGLGHVASPGLIVYKDWYEYDPGTDTWTQKADYGGGARDYACGFGIGNYGYVGTGQDTNVNVHDDWWRYDPANNNWTLMGYVPDGARDAATAFAINGKGYLGPDIFLSETWEYDPGLNSWTQKAYYPPGTTYVGCGTSLNGKGYAGFSYYLGINDWWEYDPIGDVWTQKTAMPGLPRSGSVCFAVGGFIFCGTGTDWAGVNFDDMYAYDPATNSWTPAANFPGIPRHLLASFTINGKAYCGTGTSGTNYNDFWEFGTLSGINEIAVKGEIANVFPNPVATTSTISLTNGNVTNGILEISDVTGKIIREEKNLSGNSFQLRKENLDAGIYFFTIKNENEIVGSGKFIVE
jgi:N-acetylneuraminic acid mutarotase